MMTARSLILVAPFLLLIGSPQAGDFQIKKSGQDRFRLFRNQILEPGDTLRTADDPWSMDFDSAGNVWIGPGSDLVYETDRNLRLEIGELVMQAGLEVFEVAIVGGRIVVEASILDLEVGEESSVIRRPPLKETATGGEVMLDGQSGFRLWLDPDQSVVFAYDPETETSRIIVEQGNPGDVLIELLQSKVEVVGGDFTLGELYVGESVMMVPPGSDILIRRAIPAETPEELPPSGRIKTAFAALPGDLELPLDDPFDDVGDLLEVFNVSPSQPEQ
ncbi:MAG: hypothetical protein O6952_06570 [Planctomycetota bacterium]|nr:hypothetical protein [Planctomycetota bacterium]